MARSGTPTKPRTAQAKAVKPIRTLKKTKSHRVRNIICGFLAGILSIAALLGTVSHILPAEIQAWPYVPIIVSLVPWFAILAVIALICGHCLETNNVGIAGDCGDRVASMVAVSVFLQ